MAEIAVPHEAVPYIRWQRTNLENDADIKEAYSAEIAAEFAELEPYLPLAAVAVLDVGSGMAGIDVLFWRKYRARLFLLDGTGETDVRAGFQPEMRPYNSMPVARRLLEENGVPREEISEGWPFRCHVAVSLLSWGFHYPVSTYLPMVTRVLLPGGRLILDVRKGTDGLKALENDFDHVGTVRSGKKADRICVERRSVARG